MYMRFLRRKQFHVKKLNIFTVQFRYRTRTLYHQFINISYFYPKQKPSKNLFYVRFVAFILFDYYHFSTNQIRNKISHSISNHFNVNFFFCCHPHNVCTWYMLLNETDCLKGKEKCLNENKHFSKNIYYIELLYCVYSYI